jgi:hypothetical protein
MGYHNHDCCVTDKTVVAVDERKGLPFHGDADSHAAKKMSCSNPDLPEVQLPQNSGCIGLNYKHNFNVTDTLVLGAMLSINILTEYIS